MRIGVTLPMSASDGPGRMPGWPDVRALALHAEAAGLDSVWICDHFVSEPGDRPPEGVLEAWTTLSALAAATRRVTVGTLVTCGVFRHPALLAKMAATVDGISGGRLVLGLGAGQPGLEFDAYGFPSDARIARLEETLEIVGGLLGGATVTRSGPFHRLRDAALLPPPDRRIPLLVAGGGPGVLRLAARHAQAWNTAWHGAPDDRLRSRLAAMARALADEGRAAESLRVTVGVTVADPDQPGVSPDDGAFTGPPAELARVIDAYATLGVDELIVALEPRTERSVDRLTHALTLRAAPPGDPPGGP
ncbi:LLM class flavin-dependent oxidoreductase [Dactylosporangium sp. NPDC049525]|uniref:LLM class flavin-dependent oxidoreductase n=1 Tax=Dactylosporangium sp. NPDC049525 TaxID=3154730 RepID=UPI0034330723